LQFSLTTTTTKKSKEEEGVGDFSVAQFPEANLGSFPRLGGLEITFFLYFFNFVLQNALVVQ